MRPITDAFGMISIHDQGGIRKQSPANIDEHESVPTDYRNQSRQVTSTLTTSTL
jgi:hypothetical protein